jgi:phosphate transport system substrate-binding protein
MTALAVCSVLAFGAAACGDDEDSAPGSGGSGEASGGGQNLSGNIRIDGSSTVAPLSEAAAELFRQQNQGVQVAVGTSGTGGGFERFCRGETDISDASRQIEEDEEQACAEQNIESEEITVANDALSVVVNPENDWADCLSVEELQRIWGPENAVDNWSQVRRGFPDVPIERFGPGTDSGTFDYFTEAINGEEGAQTRDYNNVGEDDNATVTGVAGSEGGIGYFGFSFFEENQQQLRAVPVRNPETGECVPPSAEAAQDGSYAPLGRQLYVYPSAEALQRPEVQAFLEFYLQQNDEIASRVGFIPLTQEQRQQELQELEQLEQQGGSGSGSGSGSESESGGSGG